MLDFIIGALKTLIPETTTIALRGGKEYIYRNTDTSEEGARKVWFYGLGRYLRDGAQSFAEYPMVEKHVAAWRKLAKGVPKGMTIKTDKGKPPVLHITPSGYESLKKQDVTELPDGCSLEVFIKTVDAILNQHAEDHADARAEALYSGIIPEGKSGGAQPELSKVKAFVSNALIKHKGVKRNKVPKLPGTVGELREYFTALDGIPVPEAYADMGAWYDAAVERALALIAQEREDMTLLGV